MSQLFEHAIVFSDLHLGLKSNSVIHNNDCNDFIDWMIKLAKEKNCETCLFLGDFHHTRASINIVTLNHSVRALEKLAGAFKNVYFLPGNHDLYYKDRRDIQSAEWARHIPGISIIDEMFTDGNVTIVPWLVGDDYKKMKKIKTKYVFGHFELPHFYMNAMIQMPDHGDVSSKDFGKVEHLFSGHFHKRQQHNNITYVGNPFPHNYADAGDDERGCMTLEWDGTPKFHNWTDGPTYRVIKLSELLNNADSLLKPKMCVRVNLDIDISYEEATFIKETFVDTYGLREITLIPNKNTGLDQDSATASISFESVDQIVQNELTQIESKAYDSKLLMGIYNSL